MKDPKKLIQTAIAGVLALSVVMPSTAIAAPAQEKCYGIAKAGMNDCETSTPGQNCSGSSTRDRQPDAYIFLPKGICSKIVGGSLKPKGQ